jgi:hypothetical protein
MLDRRLDSLFLAQGEGLVSAGGRGKHEQKNTEGTVQSAKCKVQNAK